MDILPLLFLFGVGILAGFLNVAAGGGSSLTLPALIFLGLDSALANGTNRVALIIQNLFAVWGFHQEKLNKFKLSLNLALFTLPGAVLGALLAIKISDAWFQRILGVIMILIVASMFKPGVNSINLDKKQPDDRRWMLYFTLFGLGFYGGFIQVGIGFLFMATLFHIGRLSLVHVNMHKVFIVLVYTIPALLVFILSGNVDWKLGLTLAAGNGIGGWLAARISVKKGERFIRYVLSAAIMVMALKLIIF